MSDENEYSYTICADFYEDDLTVHNYEQLKHVIIDCKKTKGAFYLVIHPCGWNNICMMRYFFNKNTDKFEVNLYVYGEINNTIYYDDSDKMTVKTISKKLLNREKIDLSSMKIRTDEYQIAAFGEAEDHLKNDHVMNQSDTLILMDKDFHISDEVHSRYIAFRDFAKQLLAETDVVLYDSDGDKIIFERGCADAFLNSIFGNSHKYPTSVQYVMTVNSDRQWQALHDPYYNNEAGYYAHIDELYEHISDSLKEQLANLFHNGKKMRAIKVCKDALNIGIIEAKSILERHFN
ncbi:MAG: hypothetical protein K6E12_08015 [Saccharofermentans sp.]|nr:hypothetical protein [Saccharofermentans sp.]